jgi:hypothetical protein
MSAGFGRQEMTYFVPAPEIAPFLLDRLAADIEVAPGHLAKNTTIVIERHGE